MFKRFVISSVLLIAFAVLQVHNCMPHHHHDEETQKAHQDDDDHSAPFNDHNHSSDFGKVVEQPPQVKFSPDGHAQILFDFTTAQIIISSVETPVVTHSFARNNIPHLPFLYSAIPLRAPPAC